MEFTEEFTIYVSKFSYLSVPPSEKKDKCQITVITLGGTLYILNVLYVYNEGNFYAKYETVLLEQTTLLCLRFVLYDMRLVNTFIIAMYSVINYLLLLLYLVVFYAKLSEI